MLFIVQFEDKPGVAELRQKLLEEHFAFLDSRKDKVLVAGSVIAERALAGRIEELRGALGELVVAVADAQQRALVSDATGEGDRRPLEVGLGDYFVDDAETVRLLLAAGADPTARDRHGRNAADRARDGLAAGAAKHYDLILRMLTDE